MLTHLRPAIVLLALFTLVTGVVYPCAVTGLAQAIFPAEANGSRIQHSGRTLGSSLIGQPFRAQRYFWGRPSATAPWSHNAAASAGSNLGPTNPALRAAVRDRVASLRAADPDGAMLPIPVDLVTTSGSGLDPHISPAAALYQVRRVARVRGLSEARVRALVVAHIEQRAFGFLGEPRVDVLLLNLALDELPQSGAKLQR